MLLGSRYRPLWLAGTASLSIAKILENMEIGHNVMHGQWDWMNDPTSTPRTGTGTPPRRPTRGDTRTTTSTTRSRTSAARTAIWATRSCASTRIRNGIPVYLLQPFYNLLLMGFFEWGVAFHDLNFDAIRAGEKSKEQLLEELKAIGVKARRQVVKDYIAFPLLSAAIVGAVGAAATRAPPTGSGAPRTTRFKSTFAANFTANIVRNVWAYSIIFCGHFPDQTYTFSQAEVADETRGGWYVRQLLGSANIDGGPLFHLIAGNLSFQVEHHLYPDMPSSRYAEIAPRVRDVCHRYGLPYNTGPFSKQLGNVQRTILRLAFPGGKPRRKPGPYRPA